MVSKVSYAWDWEEGWDKVDWPDHRAYDAVVCGQISTSRKLLYAVLVGGLGSLEHSVHLGPVKTLLTQVARSCSAALKQHQCILVWFSFHVRALMSCACGRGNQESCKRFLNWGI